MKILKCKIRNKVRAEVTFNVEEHIDGPAWKVKIQTIYPLWVLLWDEVDDYCKTNHPK